MRRLTISLIIASGCLLCVSIGITNASHVPNRGDTTPSYTYVKHVDPILRKFCRPCHDAENENPSELFMDNYEMVMKGGNHGPSVVPGKPKESSLYFKLLPNPPFGKEMPRGKKKMTEEEIRTIRDWIEQGAKKK
jgi:hypothetical protein